METRHKKINHGGNGRLKDLKGIDDLIEKLAEQVVGAQDRPKGKGRG
jgi:hypothetical protein